MSQRDHLKQLALLAFGSTAALAGGLSLLDQDASAAPKKEVKSAECFGVNTCKGTNGCAISPAQIELANRAFGNKFTKSKPVECAGNSDCSAKKGFLAWSSKASMEECFNAGGFIFDKDATGKLVIKDKAGVKS